MSRKKDKLQNIYNIHLHQTLMEFVKPKKLKEGDCVAVLSPSWGGPSAFPHIFDNGLRVLKEKFGLKIKEYPGARMDAEKSYLNPKLRAEDINNAFRDPEVKAIIASIGGDDSVRILKYLDKKAIQNNPKIFMGYSDTTTITNFINQLGMVAFNGPAVMAGFSQMENFPESIEHVKNILFEVNNSYKYKQYKEWVGKYPDWGDVKNTGKVGKREKNEGWHWIQGEERTTGKLFGGCIEVLEMLNGTEFWPQLEFWKNKILFIETSEDKPSPDFVKYIIRNYGVQGILGKINGILVGRARDYSEEETKKLEKNLIDVVSKEFNRPDLPIVTNIDFGHTEPQIILPLGIEAEIDYKNKTIKLLESAVSD